MASTKRKPTTGTRTKATVAPIAAAELLPKLRKVRRLLETIYCVADLIPEQDGNCCAGAIANVARMAKAIVERLMKQASGVEAGA